MPNSVKDQWVERLTGEPGERERATAELRELLLRGLRASVSNRYGNGFNAEDVIQEALLSIISSLDRFEGRSQFMTWATAIAIRVGISELRKKHCKDVSLSAFRNSEDCLSVEIAVDESPTTEMQMDRKLILQQLQVLIDSALTNKQRFAIRGLLEGLPIEEIAARTGSNRNAIYKLVHDARMRLREGFESAGFLAADISAIIA